MLLNELIGPTHTYKGISFILSSVIRSTHGIASDTVPLHSPQLDDSGNPVLDSDGDPVMVLSPGCQLPLTLHVSGQLLPCNILFTKETWDDLSARSTVLNGFKKNIELYIREKILKRA